MPALTTPFWIVSDRRAIVPMPLVIERAPGHVAAFTDEAKARAYTGLVAEISLVTSRNLETLVKTLRLLGVVGFCVDPDDCDCTDRVPLDGVEIVG